MIKQIKYWFISMTLKKYYVFEKTFLQYEVGDTLTHDSSNNNWDVDEDIGKHSYSRAEITAMVEQGIIKAYKPTKCSCKA